MAESGATDAATLAADLTAPSRPERVHDTFLRRDGQEGPDAPQSRDPAAMAGRRRHGRSSIRCHEQGASSMKIMQTCRDLSAAGLALAIAVTAAAQPVVACTRAMYVGPNDTIITTRSNDWLGSQETNLWIYPRGLARNGGGAPGAITWVSKYGSVTAAAWDIGTIDGLNEAGLAANALYLAESDYGAPAANDPRKPLSLTAWAQYALDNFATVAEAVAALRAEPFYIVALSLPGDMAGVAHLSLSDPTGDSAILEYIDGKLVIHHGPEFKVMTNSPTFDQQLGLDGYWQSVGGEVFLPGTNRASDRFVRASYYMDTVIKTDNTNGALATAMSVIRSASVPVGITTPGQPNIASTQWRTMSDHKNMVYYFESAFAPYLLSVDLMKVDFAEGTPVRKLTLTEKSELLADGAFVSGEVGGYFEPAEPFSFAGSE
jgi:choloylglycine hydrolase